VSTAVICRYANAASFCATAEPWLLKREAEHSILLGILPSLASGNHPCERPLYLATIGDGDMPSACAFRTPPFHLGVTRMPKRAIALLAMLEKPLIDARDSRELLIFEVDLTHVAGNTYVVIERDDGDGQTALFKRIYVVDFDATDADGYPDKRLLVDLLSIPDPGRLAGMGDPFRFPFQTPETVVVIDAQTIAVFSDNNFPFGNARADDAPDPTERIRIAFDAPIDGSRR
jgi:hypothetical protein